MAQQTNPKFRLDIRPNPPGRGAECQHLSTTTAPKQGRLALDQEQPPGLDNPPTIDLDNPPLLNLEPGGRSDV